MKRKKQVKLIQLGYGGVEGNSDLGEHFMMQGDLLLIQMTILIIIAIVHVRRHWNK